jgi:hypothetical protein
LRLLDRALHVERQIRVHLSRDPARHDTRQRGADGNGNAVAGGDRACVEVGVERTGPANRFRQDFLAGGRTHRFQHKARVGGAVLRLEAPHRIDVAGVADDYCHCTQLIEL